MWILFLFGLAFMLAAFQVNPAENCSESGECAPWLVPAARALGFTRAADQLGVPVSNLHGWRKRLGKLEIKE